MYGRGIPGGGRGGGKNTSWGLWAVRKKQGNGKEAGGHWLWVRVGEVPGRRRPRVHAGGCVNSEWLFSQICCHPLRGTEQMPSKRLVNGGARGLQTASFPSTSG